MSIELDHIFICTAVGAPEADELVSLGLNEGPPNHHPGQGTANRRFAFANAMIEFLWVCAEAEARSELSSPTLLWDRWAGRERGACPFGICTRPANSSPETAAPFPAWEYHPSYLPEPLSMHIGNAGVDEPMWVYLGFLQRADREKWFTEHPAGIREITGLTLTTPAPMKSEASKAFINAGVIAARTGSTFLMELEFDGGIRGAAVDFRPRLPIIFKF